MYSPFLELSDWLCRALAPLLARHQRLGRDFEERLVASTDWAGEIKDCRKKIWIQAASLGEAQLASQLALQLASELATVFPDVASFDSERSTPLGLLLTSTTPEGKSELLKTREKLRAGNPSIPAVVRLFPLFSQTYMRRALTLTKPDLTVLLETELWPGLLLACAEKSLPLIMLNARMSERSFKRYKLIQGLWKGFAKHGVPQHIAAISEADATRYAFFFGEERVSLMSNMKFDRAALPPAPETLVALREIIPPPEHSQTLLLASVRTEEEELLLPLIKNLRENYPDLLILVVPKHLERAQAWMRQCAAQSTHSALGKLRLRGELTPENPAHPGEVIIWDRVGELSAVYAFARSAFVGGSLAPLGGQNFLEALSQGVIPHIGPHWKNFAWVGNELLQLGLLKEVSDECALEASLRKDLGENNLEGHMYIEGLETERANIRATFAKWLRQRQGGTKQAASLIWNNLK